MSLSKALNTLKFTNLSNKHCDHSMPTAIGNTPTVSPVLWVGWGHWEPWGLWGAQAATAYGESGDTGDYEITEVSGVAEIMS